ncbi:MAG: alpha-L-fucosidase [Limisphaerales bacterium]
MKNKIFILAMLAGLLTGFAYKAGAADVPDLKYGLYIHYGLPTFAKAGEQGEIPAGRFAPTALDVKSWAHAAKEAGMTFAVLTAKHHSGFCLWDSADYDYDITHSPVKTDLLADFIAACDSEGILPGVHYSIPDVHNEGTVQFQGSVTPLYFSLIKKQITELHTKYPGLRVQIFESSGRFTSDQWQEINQLIHRLNPHCIILDGRNDSPYMTKSVIVKSWMWHPQAQLLPVTALFAAYNKAVTSGQPFILNVGPAPSSRIPEDQFAILGQMKELIAHPPESMAATSVIGKPDATERLKKVKSLYDQGLINKEDYDKKVKEIMDSL